MRIDEAIQELRQETTPNQACDLTISKILDDRGRPSPKSLWLIPAFATTAVVAFALWPRSDQDMVWAHAIRSLQQSHRIHLIFTEKGKTVEAWLKDGKARRLEPKFEVRSNGSQITRRQGLVNLVKTTKDKRFAMYFGVDLMAFRSAEELLETKKPIPLQTTLDGKAFNTYTFDSGSICIMEPLTKNGRSSSQLRAIGKLVAVALVDPSTERIVKLRQFVEPDPGYLKQTNYPSQAIFDAKIDYPDDIPDAMFDPPAGAIDEAHNRAQFANLVNRSLGQQSVAGQRVDLKALLWDGLRLSVLWKGCPGEYRGPRFFINGHQIGKADDFGSLTTSKVLRPESSGAPCSALGEDVDSPLPSTVDLTLPVFAEDRSQPFLNGKKVVGYHSRKVGDAVFKHVPITPVLPLTDLYQFQFALNKNFW